MRLLLDTHALYWWLDDDPRLRATARAAIVDAALVAVSTVSVWEIAIELSLGKLRLDLDEMLRQATLDGFERLPIEDRHCRRYAALPVLHRDPFDRMLAAQALEEGLTLLTDDRHLPSYRALGLELMRCG